EMAFQDLAGVSRRHGGIPHAIGVDHHHRSVAALAKAAGMVDADPPGQLAGADGGLEGAVDPQPVTVNRGAPLAPGADEDVSLKDGHSRKYPCRRIESTGAPQPTPTLLSGQKPRAPHPNGPRGLAQHWETDLMISQEVGKLLTATEVAEMLHLHVNTVKRLGDRGEIPFYRVCKRGDRRSLCDDVLHSLRRAK